MSKLRRHPIHRNVFLTEKGRVFFEVKASPSDNGYHTVKIRAGKSSITVRRHTLMCEAFNGLAPKPNMVVRHLNGDPGDDSPKNLKWGTTKQNGKDTIKHGRTTRGEKNTQVKLTKKEAIEILKRRLHGESGSILSAEYNISQASICDLYKGRTWPELNGLRRKLREN